MKLRTFDVLLLVSMILSASMAPSEPAEISHPKMRHRHSRAHHVKVHKTTTANESEDNQYKRTLPPNIWMLLAENSIDSHNESNGSKFSDNDEARQNEISNDNVDFDPKSDHDLSIKASSKCPKCAQNSVKMSEDELTTLRIEYVKNQILHKLRMNERPPKKDTEDLPEPLQEGYAIQADQNADYFNRHLDDYFAKTTQKIIFLNQGTCLCFHCCCHF